MVVNSAMRRIMTAVESAEHVATRGLDEGRIETEPTLTDRFLGALEEAFGNGIEADGYFMRVRTLRDRGPNAPEREFGADIVSVLRVALPEYEISKGFLAQAKMANKEGITFKSNYKKFPDIFFKQATRALETPNSLYMQCRQMLAISPDSYLFVYSNIGIYVIPATTIVSIAPDGEPHKIYMKTLRWFMEDFIRSFIGDWRLKAYDDKSLRELRDLNLSNSALMFELQESQAGSNVASKKS